MDWLPDRLTYPHVLLGALFVVLVLAIVVAGATSTVSLSPYNAQWDGSSDLRNIADSNDRESIIVRDMEQYADVSPNASIAVITSPNEPYTVDERQTIRDFIKAGGTVVFAGETADGMNPLLATTGTSIRLNGTPLRDERNYYRGPQLPVATNVTQSPYTESVDSLSLNHATALHVGDDAEILINSSEYAYLDVNGDETVNEDERMGQYPVVATQSIGDGQVLVISDSSIFINTMLERTDNRQFVETLFGLHQTVLLDYSHTGGIPPLPWLVLTLRDSLLLQVLLGVFVVTTIAAATKFSLPWPTDDHPSSTPQPSTDELVDVLANRHPEWDPEKIQRIAENRLRENEEDSDPPENN